jgi:hypothetical protein
MSNILVTLTKNTSAVLPAGITFASTSIVVTDSAGTAQTFSLTGVESPAWSQLVTLAAEGAGTVVATDLDTTGAPIGTPVSQGFSTTGTGGGSTFPATTAIVVSPA